MQGYPTLRALEAGEAIEIDGLRLVKDEGEIRPGDLYVAERNGGPKLLTAGEVDKKNNWIVPTTRDYCYDLWECAKVREA